MITESVSYMSVRDFLAPEKFEWMLRCLADRGTRDYTVGHQTFPNLCIFDGNVVREEFEKAAGFPIVMRLAYFREYHRGVKQPTWIHNDPPMGEFSAVLSLRDDNGAVAFWSPRPAARDEDPEETRFFLIGEIPLSANVCAIYRSAINHSRMPRHWDQDEPRRVAVFFFDRGDA